MHIHATMLTMLSALLIGGFVMDNPAAAIDLTTPVPNLGASNPAKKLVCKPRVVSRGSGGSQEAYASGFYAAAARERWKQDVTSRYGAAFSQWSIALKRRGACTKISGARPRYYCSAAATPCKLAR